ncbi:MAG TPA: catalase family protein [Allosphingosinicella sp.]|jgi:hypothetical protein
MTELTRFETREAGEEQNVTRIIEILRAQQLKAYRPGGTLRDAHTKRVGLVEAEFTVEPDLPEALRVGLFAEPRRYGAWVRFSSASEKSRSDAIKDIRGAAIKVRDVPGERIPESDEPTTQDFLMVSAPTMPLGTVRLFKTAVALVNQFSPLLFAALLIVTGRFRVLKSLGAMNINPTSPVDIRYWSTTPYLFGPDRAAKYSIVPTSSYVSTLPAKPGDSYLADNLQEHLSRADATFDFLVQLRTDPETMPIEDTAVEWREDEAPFVKVATLRIPQQQFRTEERDSMAAALSFSPGHALVEHRPIGGVNRARMRVYREQADFRQTRDGVQRKT